MKRLRSFLLTSLVLVAAHAVLLHWMADRNVMSVIFAAGSHVPIHVLLLAGVFIFLRLWVLLFLPGLVLYHLGRAALERHN